MERHSNRKLTSMEVCDRLRITRRTLHRWLKMGKILSLRPGHKHLFTEREIERVLNIKKGTQK